jgi:hypothetical protein
MVMQMGTISYLAEPRLKRIGGQVRSDVAKLRQQRLILLAANDQPIRNPDLDTLLDLLRILRVDYDLQIRKLEAHEGAEAIENSVLARAREILGDVAELIDLLCPPIGSGNDCAAGSAEGERGW